MWRAHDRRHDRPVALKIRKVRAPDDREDFLREARVLLDLKPHPSLPLVRDDFFEDDDYHLVMDWIEGTNLADLVAQQGTPGLPIESVLGLVRQVAEALDHLHGHRPPIVHQDVKPANVIARPDGDVVLVDLGISGRSREPIPDPQGTPAYRAPELAGGAAPAPAADVYGLAATAFTLLVGSPPRPGPRPPITGVSRAHVARLWRALDAGLAYDPERRPATASTFVEAIEPAAAPTNLPSSVSAFVGREQDLAAVTDLLAMSRLVTLTGAGGLGKTRLALEVARRMAPAYGDGVWLAELAPLRNGALIPSVVAALFGVEEQRGRSLREGLLEELRDRSALLILDNCEHLLEDCISFATDVLVACPAVDLLATSRQALGAAQEVVTDVQPLSLPAAQEASVKALTRSDAVRLFLDRAASVRPGFKLTVETARVVSRICRRLDGMPLAIELAASQVGRLDADEIADRLEESLTLLQREEPGARRHETLQAAFEWSYSLLSSEERRAFARVAVFPGGFSAGAAELVAAGPDGLSENVARLIADLTAKSLLTSRIDETDEPRYRMLETVRTFASGKLIELGDEVDAREAALVWALAFARAADRELEGPKRVEFLERLDIDHENLSEGLSFALKSNGEAALELACSLAAFWAVRGPWSEGRAFLNAVLSSGVGSDERRAIALDGAGSLAFLEADYDDARRLHGEALQLRRNAGDRSGVAKSLASLGMVAEARVELELARDLYGQSLATYRELDDARGIAAQLTNLGNVAEYSSDYETAQELHEESLAQRRAMGDEHGVATSLLNLSYVMSYQGDARGREALEECIALFRALGDRYGASRALNLLAIRSWFEGDGEQARSLGEEALRLRRDIGDRLWIAVSLESLGGLAAFQGHGVYAATLFGAAERLREVIGSPITPSDEALMNWARSDARRSVGDEAFEQAMARGRALRTEEAMALALTRPEKVSDEVVSS